MRKVCCKQYSEGGQSIATTVVGLVLDWQSRMAYLELAIRNVESMNSARCSIIVQALILSGVAGLLYGQEKKPEMEILSWISGCWENASGARTMEERWTKLAGESMLGVNRTVKDGKTVAYEFIRIAKQGEDIYYIAKPSGQAEASFKLVKWSDDEAVFENPDHDFPQRIIYRRQEDGSLHSRIEGTSKGKERGIDFPMQRVTCE